MGFEPVPSTSNIYIICSRCPFGSIHILLVLNKTNFNSPFLFSNYKKKGRQYIYTTFLSYIQLLYQIHNQRSCAVLG